MRFRQPTPGEHNVWHRIMKERERQDAKWGTQSHSDLTWFSILMEEGWEAMTKAFNAAIFGKWETEDVWEKFEEELIQCLAVGVAWLADRYKRRRILIEQELLRREVERRRKE